MCFLYNRLRTMKIDVFKDIMARISWMIVLITCALNITVERIVGISIIVIICATFKFVLRWRRRKKLRNQVQEETESTESTEWMKLRGGETMRSYRMWLDCDYCRGKPFDEYCHTIVHEPLPTNGDWNRWNASDPKSILMTINREIPTATVGTREIILRRYSLLSSDIYSDILRINYFKDPTPNPTPKTSTWIFSFGSSVGEGIVDIVFGCSNRPWQTVFLVDTRRPTYAQVYLAAPLGFWRPLRSYRDEKQPNRLIILFTIQDENGYMIRFEVAEYEIELVRHPSKLFAQRTRIVVIPVVGNLKLGTYDWLNGCYSLIGNTVAESKVVTFDRRFNATFHPLDEFWRELRASTIGQRVLAAVNDFVALLSEAERENVFIFTCGCDMIMGNIGDVFSRRYVRPPSLLFQAAETFCRLHPYADLSTLESRILFDVFDGIFEEQKKPTMMITLSNDMSMLV